MIQKARCIVFFLFVAFPCQGQTEYTGIVWDAEFNQAVPYANIGVPGTTKGTVSNLEGVYLISVSSGVDSLVFSSIGYHTQTIALQYLAENDTVYLMPRVYEGGEIIVRSKGYKPTRSFGNRQKKKGQSFGFETSQKGGQIGSVIHFRDTTLVESAHFGINFTGGDSLLFRVQVYPWDNGVTGESVLPENVLISTVQERGYIHAGLLPYNLHLKGTYLLTLEWLDRSSMIKNEGIRFRAKTVRRKNNTTYLRYNAITEFEQLKYVNYQLAFYITGKELAH